MELDAPVLTAAAAPQLHHEPGIDGRSGTAQPDRPVAAAAELRWRPGQSLDTAGEAARPRLRFVIALMTLCRAPGEFRAGSAGWAGRRGEAVPARPAETVRCIVDSLALGHRARSPSAVTVGGTRTWFTLSARARNELLCQLTADATGLP